VTGIKPGDRVILRGTVVSIGGTASWPSGRVVHAPPDRAVVELSEYDAVSVPVAALEPESLSGEDLARLADEKEGR
jgi:hypothetical protein